MSENQAKLLAHELTIEYIKAHPGYLSNSKENIPGLVDKIADINKRFYDAIIKNQTLSRLY